MPPRPLPPALLGTLRAYGLTPEQIRGGAAWLPGLAEDGGEAPAYTFRPDPIYIFTMPQEDEPEPPDLWARLVADDPF